VQLFPPLPPLLPGRFSTMLAYCEGSGFGVPVLLVIVKEDEGGGGGVPRDRFQRLNGYVSCAEKFSGKKFVFA